MKEVAKWAGIKPTPVQIQNIVIGDLPCIDTGDFYLTIECSNNPGMCSDVAAESSPLIANFNQVFTLMIRDTVLEGVTFVVKDMRVAGSVDLATIELNASHIIQKFILDDDGRRAQPGTFRRMRFAMEPIVKGHEFPTIPWISFEIGYPEEFVGGVPYTVPLFTYEDVVQDGVSQNDQVESGVWKTVPIVDFKKDYLPLHDVRGNKVNEPKDVSQKLDEEKKTSNKRLCGVGVVWFFLLVAGIAWRAYLWRCWKEYQILAEVRQMIRGNDTYSISWEEITFPVRQDIYDEAYKHYDKMPDAEVIETCDHPPGPADAPTRPLVFNHWAKKNLNGHSIPCPGMACEWRETLVKGNGDKIFWLSIAGLTVAFLCWECCRPYSDEVEGPKNDNGAARLKMTDEDKPAE